MLRAWHHLTALENLSHKTTTKTLGYWPTITVSPIHVRRSRSNEPLLSSTHSGLVPEMQPPADAEHKRPECDVNGLLAAGHCLRSKVVRTVAVE